MILYYSLQKTKNRVALPHLVGCVLAFRPIPRYGWLNAKFDCTYQSLAFKLWCDIHLGHEYIASMLKTRLWQVQSTFAFNQLYFGKGLLHCECESLNCAVSCCTAVCRVVLRCKRLWCIGMNSVALCSVVLRCRVLQWSIRVTTHWKIKNTVRY